jgi:hypothetical protein
MVFWNCQNHSVLASTWKDLTWLPAKSKAPKPPKRKLSTSGEPEAIEKTSKSNQQCVTCDVQDEGLVALWYTIYLGEWSTSCEINIHQFFENGRCDAFGVVNATLLIQFLYYLRQN